MDAIDSFDPMAMPYLGNAVSTGMMPHSDYLHSAPGMNDIPDHLSNFDADPYMR